MVHEQWVVQGLQGVEEFPEALRIRTRVFVEEQGVDPVLEHDEIDAQATHFLARRAGTPLGTARAFPDPVHADRFWIGRVAVLPEARGQGCGKALMSIAIEWCREAGAREIHLHSQAAVESMYRALGFHTVGEPFLEAGIRHVHMVMTFPE